MYPLKKFSLGELKSITTCVHKAAGEPILYRLITKPLCTRLQKYVPKKITPNTITWVGFLVMLAGFILTMIFDYRMVNPPRFVSLANAIFTLIYTVTDSLDGIHARGSNQCTPIGKIIDHFIDSSGIFFILVTLSSSLRVGQSPVFASLFASLLSGFYVSLVIEKFTGFTIFSSFSGSSEGLYISVFFHLLSFIKPEYILKLTGPIGRTSKPMALLITYSVLYIAGLFIDMLNRFRKTKPRMAYKYLGLAVGRYVALMVLFVPYLVQRNLSKYVSITYLLIFNQAFSICFLEEYLASMTKLSVCAKPFLVSYAILALKGINLLFLRWHALEHILIAASTVHFLLRAGSVLWNLSQQLKIKLFNRKY